MCKKAAASIIFSLISFQGNRLKKNKIKQSDQMFTEEQRSWRLPDELITGNVGFSFVPQFLFRNQNSSC